MKKIVLSALAIATLSFTSCSDDNNVETTSNLALNINGLKDLGSNFKYEGWVIVNGAPVSTGTFTVDADGKLDKTSFEVDKNKLKSAAKFVLTIEPSPDNDPKPSATKYLAGDFSGSTANVNTGIVGDFSASWGKYILATPTDGASNNENSGVWFLEAGMPPKVGLGLPTLKEGWKYEGWAVVNGMPLTTGKFTKLAATDEGAPFSGDMALPAPNGADGFFPGEDFLKKAPTGVTFPLDLSGAKIVISVEPDPDNSPKPFELKPLVGDVPAMAADHTNYDLGKGNVASISGTVTR